MSLSQSDRTKLINDGYMVIRHRDDYKTPAIVHFTKPGSWLIFQDGFSSKAARDRRMKELLKNDKIIED